MKQPPLSIREVFLTADLSQRRRTLCRLAEFWLRTVVRQVRG